MNINNPIDLYHFLSGHGLQRMSPEAQNFVNSMDVLERMCPCDPPAAKSAQVHSCIAQYVNFAQKARSHSSTLHPKSGNTKILFFNNGQLIGST